MHPNILVWPFDSQEYSSLQSFSIHSPTLYPPPIFYKGRASADLLSSAARGLIDNACPDRPLLFMVGSWAHGRGEGSLHRLPSLTAAPPIKIKGEQKSGVGEDVTVCAAEFQSYGTRIQPRAGTPRLLFPECAWENYRAILSSYTLLCPLKSIDLEGSHRWPPGPDLNRNYDYQEDNSCLWVRWHKALRRSFINCSKHS